MGSIPSYTDDRVERLLSRMTLAEKCTLLSGKDMWETHSLPQHGIRSLKTSDGPAGVRGSRWTDGTFTTQIPCGISLGATFNPGLITRVGAILGSEAKSKGVHVLLAPTMNISRSPLGGRNFENFGEDPFLTGKMASAYINGIQQEGVGACMKHYVANDMETRRFNMDETIDQRTLREIYLKPFHMALEAKPATAMTAYPKINGVHADMSQALVRNILRDEWGYHGLVMSDWGGLNDTVGSILATTDLEMPGPPLRYGESLTKAVKQGLVSESKHVDPSVRRLLVLLEASGCLYEPIQGVSVDDPVVEGESDTPQSRATAREAASEGIVLLQNKGILPLSPQKTKNLAIIGPNAKNPTVGGTGSAVVNPYYITTPYESIKALANHQDMDVVYERGIFTHLQPPLIGHCLTQPGTGSPGFKVDFYAGDSFQGPIVATTYWQDSLVYFMSDGDVPKTLKGTVYTYKATGLLRPSVTGMYDFSLSNTGKAKLFIDDELVIDNTDWKEISGNFMNCGSVECFASKVLDAGRTYVVRVDNLVVPPPTKPHDNTLFHKISGVRVGMIFGHDEDKMFRDAVAAAEAADTAILVVGHNNDTEREGSDRTSLSLPGRTDQLISAVCAANKNTIVVTQSACAIAMPWHKEAGAIVHAWYQGQECGNAIADALFGAVNPSGKLPLTFPHRLEDHGSNIWFPGDATNDKAEYGEGVLVGYRWFDNQRSEPLWPFGYGLSYTSFSIGLVESTAGKGNVVATVHAAVTNTGAVAGSEVVQVYVLPSTELVASGLPVAPKQLAGFRKLFLYPGAKGRVDIEISKESLKWFDADADRWRLDKGKYQCLVGTSSRELPHVVDIFVS